MPAADRLRVWPGRDDIADLPRFGNGRENAVALALAEAHAHGLADADCFADGRAYAGANA